MAALRNAPVEGTTHADNESHVGLASSDAHAALMRSIRSAAVSGESGELVLRRGGLTGRVYVLRGMVAWAHCIGVHHYLVDHIAQAYSLDVTELKELLGVCRSEGRQFGDYLVDIGLLSECEMRASLAEHFRRQMAALASAPGEFRSLFLPMQQSFSGRFLFEAAELWPEDEYPDHAAASDGGLAEAGFSAPEAESRRLPTLAAMARFRAVVDQAMGIAGAVHAAVLDMTTGETVEVRSALGFEGEAKASDRVALVARGVSGLLAANGSGGEDQGDDSADPADLGAEDVIVTSADRYALLRSVSRHHIAYLVVSRASGNLAMARIQLRTIAGTTRSQLLIGSTSDASARHG